MTDSAIPTRTEERPESPPASRAGRGWLILAGFVAVNFVLGAVAGVYAGTYFGGGEPAAETAHAADARSQGGPAAVAEAPIGTRQEVEVGRITVVIPSDGQAGGTIHLLISPLVVGYPEGTAEAAKDHETEAEAPTAELRDAFIEYLSQLHETEVRGSLGLATLRAELLRRSRAVVPDLNPTAVLIQEFLIQ